MRTPDPKTHLQISIAKSFIRIFAGACLISQAPGGIIWAGILLVLAEVLGIAEELF